MRASRPFTSMTAMAAIAAALILAATTGQAADAGAKPATLSSARDKLCLGNPADDCPKGTIIRYARLGGMKGEGATPEWALEGHDFAARLCDFDKAVLVSEPMHIVNGYVETASVVVTCIRR